MARFVSIMDGLEAARGASLSALLEQLLLDTGYLRHLSSVEDSGERLENIDQLRAVINQYEETGGEDSDLAYFLEGVALVADVDELGEEQPDAVTLITLHAAKGLEFPVVFLLGLEEGVLPHLRSFDVPVQMEEERRLAYVGMTRARDRLYLLRAYRRFSMGAHLANPISRFLRDVPAHLLRPYSSGGPRSYVEAKATPQPQEVDERPKSEEAWQPGDKVVHPSFGQGTVVSVDGRRSDTELTIAFDGKGIKRISLAYISLARD